MNEDDLRNWVKTKLIDEYTLKILAATSLRPVSARDIAYKFNISLSSVYRIIKELENFGLVEVAGTELTRDGKRYNLYLSQVENIEIFIHKDKIKIKFHVRWHEPLEIESNLPVSFVEVRE